MTQEYSPSELLICLASRVMEDGSTAFIGTGIPMLAASLAQAMHAPNLVPVFEFGGTGAILEKLPLAVGDMRTYNKGVAASGYVILWKQPNVDLLNMVSWEVHRLINMET